MLAMSNGSAAEISKPRPIRCFSPRGRKPGTNLAAGTFSLLNGLIGDRGFPMIHLRYVVVRREGEWKIVQAGRRHSGSYPSRRQALCAAIEYAEKDGQPGRRVEVLVREEDGHFLTEWSFGRDLHPDEATQPILTPSR
jgi:hypothetical protein